MLQEADQARESWDRDEENRTRLAEILQDPVFQRAVALLRLTNAPLYVLGSAEPDVLVARRFAHAAGFEEFPVALNRLLRTRAPGGQDLPPDFQYLKPEGQD